MGLPINEDKTKYARDRIVTKSDNDINEEIKARIQSGNGCYFVLF